MFESDLLDRLSRVHPAVPPVIFLPAIAVLFVVGVQQQTTAATVGLVVAGWLFWTLIGVLDPPAGLPLRAGVRPGRALPLDHPRRPSRPPERPAAPGHAAVRQHPAGGRLLRAVRARAWAARRAASSRRGFLLGYLVYDMTHYYLHHRQPEVTLRADDAGAAHAPPLPGRHARVRDQRPVLGLRVRHAAEARSLSAAERIRTSTSQRTQAPEACASASSATAAGRQSLASDRRELRPERRVIRQLELRAPVVQIAALLHLDLLGDDQVVQAVAAAARPGP